METLERVIGPYEEPHAALGSKALRQPSSYFGASSPSAPWPSPRHGHEEGLLLCSFLASPQFFRGQCNFAKGTGLLGMICGSRPLIPNKRRLLRYRQYSLESLEEGCTKKIRDAPKNPSVPSILVTINLKKNRAKLRLASTSLLVRMLWPQVLVKPSHLHLNIQTKAPYGPISPKGILSKAPHSLSSNQNRATCGFQILSISTKQARLEDAISSQEHNPKAEKQR